MTEYPFPPSGATNELTLDTVLIVADKEKMVMNNTTFTVLDLINAIERLLLRGTASEAESSTRSLITEAGVEVRALVPGSQWKEGRITLGIEFVPKQLDAES